MWKCAVKHKNFGVICTRHSDKKAKFTFPFPSTEEVFDEYLWEYMAFSEEWMISRGIALINTWASRIKKAWSSMCSLPH